MDGRRPEEAVLLGVRGRQGMERWEDPELQVEPSTAQREAEGLQPEPGPEVLAHALAVAGSVVSGAGVLKIGIWVDPLLRLPLWSAVTVARGHGRTMPKPLAQASKELPGIEQAILMPSF